MLAAPGIFQSQCDVAYELAGALGCGYEAQRSLTQIHETWDGNGFPAGLRGEAISVAIRLANVALDAELWFRIGGLDAVSSMLRARSGTMYDPTVCFAILDSIAEGELWSDPRVTWRHVLAAEPGNVVMLRGGELDRALVAVGEFADLKSPFTLGHSSRVAQLATTACTWLGFGRDDIDVASQASWLHDVGRVGVSANVWERSGPLSEADWARVRMHPHYTAEVFGRVQALSGPCFVGSTHHERLDGSGYHRGLRGESVSQVSRVLSAADAYTAMTTWRPHRAAYAPELAAEMLRDEARRGLLDSRAVEGVLSAAGHTAKRTARRYPAGLTEREVEVMRLLARGRTVRQIADELFISPSTAGRHVEHIYDKVGVSSRAGAALFAMRNGLC